MARWREKPQRAILEEFPPRLLLSAWPRCVCSRCAPGLSDRVVAECAVEAWSQARREWCAEHGFSLLELLRAERQARREGAPS